MQEISTIIQRMGMIINPCDSYAWNILDNRKQITIIFYINNLMIAHINPVITTKYVKLLNGVYSNNDLLTVTRDTVYEYLGMTIDFVLKSGCTIIQYDFIKKMHNDLNGNLKGVYRNTLAADFLFKVNLKAELLLKDKKEEYYRTTAKYLWISQRSRPNL